jgi:IS605 OrfB family transposase
MQLRTIQIDITHLLTEANKLAISNTIVESKKVFDLFIKLGIEHKSTNYKTLHKYGYNIAKLLCPILSTAIIQQTAKVALSSLKSYNSNIPNYNAKIKLKNKWLAKQGKSLKPYKNKWEYIGSKSANSYCVNLLTLSRRGDLTTFKVIGERIRVLFSLPQWFDNRYANKKLQAGTIQLTKQGKVYINLIYSLKIKPKINESNEIIGIDRGIYNVATTSEGELFTSQDILRIKRQRKYLRKQLQQKGTRSSKRKLQRLSGKEKRFMLNENHKITKILANNPNVKTYVIEDLSKILIQESKGKYCNSLLHNWSFNQFEFQLQYKCYYNQIEVIKVDPSYTSQICSICNKKGKRYKSIFTCNHCGLKLHSDINASRNIKSKYILTLEGEAGCFQPTNSSKSNMI